MSAPRKSQKPIDQDLLLKELRRLGERLARLESIVDEERSDDDGDDNGDQSEAREEPRTQLGTTESDGLSEDQIIFALRNLEMIVRSHFAEDKSRSTPANGPAESTITTSQALAHLYSGGHIQPAAPIPWLWKRISRALGMNPQTMYYGKPLKSINKTALTKQLNDIFDDKGIKIFTWDLKKAKTVGDVYDVVLAKL